MDQEIKQNLVEEANNKNNSLRKSIEILAEMTRADIERFNYINLKSEVQNQ